MTNLLTRVADAIKSDFYEEKKNDNKNNPIHTLNRYLRECEEEVEKVASLVERQRLLKNEFTKELNTASSMVSKREQHVRLAEEAGESELAAAALRELTHYQGRKDRLEISVQEVAKQLHTLEQMHTDMKHKLKDMYIKRLEVMGKENMAQANKKAEHVFAEEDAGQNAEELRFKKIEAYLQQLEKDEVQEEEQTVDQQIAELQKRMNQKQNSIES
ncbi:PspA/IM30 family protein [Jeotgalibacillus sp. S-D1]|uniref:PspA/IM30 family protein n=1 Tax=Jeotgalibacillus sp. S-D1 TaxID=2552189 RepID=UPI00105999BE|nr:PspA/IM30 family protein [Jeotgalibacillus sp. S-D1]TDL30719.1 PspA/IM30 family protein [Jeotgalibacillus sp. S-D1]